MPEVDHANSWVVSLRRFEDGSTYVLCAFSTEQKARSYIESKRRKELRDIFYLTPLTLDAGRCAPGYEGYFIEEADV